MPSDLRTITIIISVKSMAKKNTVNKHAQALGRLGGEKTLAKHGASKLREWGKMGGRPKKLTS